MNSLTQKELSRFWGKVDKKRSYVFYNGTRCWEWKGVSHSDSYGQMRVGGKELLTHRISYELAFGEIQGGLLVLHHCDNPSCVNPDHLFLGTDKDNTDDKVKKKRQPRGASHGRAKLTNEQVSEIRRRYARRGEGGETLKELSREFDVAFQHVSLIVRNKIWKDD